MTATSPARSPAAERFDPPLRREAWIAERTLALREFLAEARARWGDDASFERVLWHAGLHVNGHPLILGQRDAGAIAAGSWIAVYGFVREPEPVEIGPDALLFQGCGLVAVNKPAWITMQGSRASQRLSLEGRIRERLGCPTLAAVHRLDRQTSGVAVFARDRQAAAWWGRELSGRRVSRRYLAWVAPPPARDRFEVAGYLVRAPHPSRFRFALLPERVDGGRFSHTRFETLAAHCGRALVRAEPTTGRTHQLRVHLACAGSPAIGDDLYGPTYREGAPWSAPRVQLHAASVGVRLPDGRPITIEAPLPPCFRAPASILEAG